MFTVGSGVVHQQVFRRRAINLTLILGTIFEPSSNLVEFGLRSSISILPGRTRPISGSHSAMKFTTWLALRVPNAFLCVSNKMASSSAWLLTPSKWTNACFAVNVVSMMMEHFIKCLTQARVERREWKRRTVDSNRTPISQLS